MLSLFEIINPSFLLFPALLGSLVLGLVCPLVGAHLVLRRMVLLGLTLPQVAAAGIAFAAWLKHLAAWPEAAFEERSVAMIGPFLFAFLGMATLAYLDRRGKGRAEGRLAVAYALAGALTILLVVFNPAGEVEILSLLKGEMISLSVGELRVLAAAFGTVFLGIVYFRREFLISGFDRDLTFLLKGGSLPWDLLLHLLAGIGIAVGVMAAGPLLMFGLLVLPPLAARPLAGSMGVFLFLSSLLGGLMAFSGFYLSVAVDLPLGPVDVAFGCGLVFLAHALKRLKRILREAR
jgi:ABC-type Mn2+/Zn2+ transport system permease subunit